MSRDEPLVFFEDPERYSVYAKNGLGEIIVDVYGSESGCLNYPWIEPEILPENISGMNVCEIERLLNVRGSSKIKHIAAEYKKGGFNLRVGLSGPIEGGIGSSIS